MQAVDYQTPVNNPYTTRWARYYDRLLLLPPWSQIRRSEERTLAGFIEAALRPGDSVLEVGPGTGRYTVEFARRVAEITAVEHSPEMVAQLHRRLEREGVRNCTVIQGEFVQTPIASTFDVVVTIGVLDYVEDPAAFLGKAAGLARRELLFTTPSYGFLAKLHRDSNRLRGIDVNTFTPAQVRACLPDYQIQIEETGLGLTLACRATRA